MSDSPTPFVFIVIVNWNGKDDLLAGLDSLEKIDYPKERYKILVVDNGSSDGSREAVVKRGPHILVLENEKNLGYAKAVNQGIAYGLKLGAEYLWILNNDVVVAAETLSRLVEVGQKDATAGVMGPIIYSLNEPMRIENAAYSVNFWIGWLRRLKYGVDIFKDDSSKTSDVDTIFGCSNLIKATVFPNVGFLRTIYNVYFEETDFNVRARRHGFRVVAVRDAHVWHKSASTMNRFIFRRALYLLRNLFLFEIFNANFIQLLVFIPYYFLIHVPYFLVRGSVYALAVKFKGKSE